MGGSMPLPDQNGTVAYDPALRTNKSARARFVEQTLQSAPGRKGETAKLFYLEPMGYGLPHQLVTDFLRWI